MTAPTPDIRDEARTWAAAHWDPDMSVAQWWDLLADACYSLPSLPRSAYGRGYSRAEEQDVWQAFAVPSAKLLQCDRL